MAKIVSAVPQLLTSTIGAITAEPPKQAVVEVPVATPTPTATTDTSTDSSISGPDLSDDLNTITDRSRGRLGTITTSFRGVLNDSNNTSSRRTLLGE